MELDIRSLPNKSSRKFYWNDGWMYLALAINSYSRLQSTMYCICDGRRTTSKCKQFWFCRIFRKDISASLWYGANNETLACWSKCNSFVRSFRFLRVQLRSHHMLHGTMWNDGGLFRNWMDCNRDQLKKMTVQIFLLSNYLKFY